MSREQRVARLLGLGLGPLLIATSALLPLAAAPTSLVRLLAALPVAVAGWLVALLGRTLDRGLPATTSGRASLLACVTISLLSWAHLVGQYFGFWHGEGQSYGLWDGAVGVAVFSWIVLGAWELSRWENFRRQPRFWVGRAVALGLGPAVIWLPGELMQSWWLSDSAHPVLPTSLCLVAGWAMIMLAAEIDPGLRSATTGRLRYFIGAWAMLTTLDTLRIGYSGYIEHRQLVLNPDLPPAMCCDPDPWGLSLVYLAALIASFVAFVTVEVVISWRRRRHRVHGL